MNRTVTIRCCCGLTHTIEIPDDSERAITNEELEDLSVRLLNSPSPGLMLASWRKSTRLSAKKLAHILIELTGSDKTGEQVRTRITSQELGKVAINAPDARNLIRALHKAHAKFDGEVAR